MSLWWEKYYPVIFGSFFSVIILVLGIDDRTKGMIAVINGVITYTSISIGFLGALLGIIISISNTAIMKHTTEHWKKKGKNVLLRYFNESIVSGLIVVSLSILSFLEIDLFLDFEFRYHLFILWIFAFLFFFFSTFRIIKILLNILSHVSEESALQSQSNKLTEDQLQMLMKIGIENKKLPKISKKE